MPRYYISFTINQAMSNNQLSLYVRATLPSGTNTTGWQLEPGSVPTPFEHRPIGTELALCQRYFFKSDGLLVSLVPNFSNSNLQRSISILRPVAMRTTPTENIPTPANGTVSSSNPTAQIIRIAYATTNANNNITLNADYT